MVNYVIDILPGSIPLAAQIRPFGITSFKLLWISTQWSPGTADSDRNHFWPDHEMILIMRTAFHEMDLASIHTFLPRQLFWFVLTPNSRRAITRKTANDAQAPSEYIYNRWHYMPKNSLWNKWQVAALSYLWKFWKSLNPACHRNILLEMVMTAWRFTDSIVTILIFTSLVSNLNKTVTEQNSWADSFCYAAGRKDWSVPVAVRSTPADCTGTPLILGGWLFDNYFPEITLRSEWRGKCQRLRNLTLAILQNLTKCSMYSSPRSSDRPTMTFD